MSRRRMVAVGVTAALLVAGLPAAIVAVSTSDARAAAGCRVDYSVVNQWPGGFTGGVTVTNLGEQINGWVVEWEFSAGQHIMQAWATNLTQTGARVRAANPDWSSVLPSNGTAMFGFNASWNGQNPPPASFALNGTTCTGTLPSTTTPPATTPPTTTPPPTTPPPTTPPPTTPPPTTPPPTTPPPTTPPVTTPPPTTTPPTPTGTPTTPPGSYPNPGRVTGDIFVHDPTMLRAPDGTYLLVHTGDNLPIKTSTDRIAFRNAGVVWPNGAPWTAPYTGGGRSLWAPHLSYHNGQYYLYYSASTFGSRRSAIFLATSPSGRSGTWTHQGLIIETNDSSSYNAIDPHLFVDVDGSWWLAFGSFWTGIKLIRLDPATGRRSTTDTAVRSLATRPSSVGGAIEAPTIVRRGGFYYLFASFDRCCQGAQSTYRIMVGRSTSVTGPYVDRNGTPMTAGGGTQVLAGHGSINGPGHQDFFTDSDADVLVYHYYANDNSARLGINLIGWDSAGWPFVF